MVADGKVRPDEDSLHTETNKTCQVNVITHFMYTFVLILREFEKRLIPQAKRRMLGICEMHLILRNPFL